MTPVQSDGRMYLMNTESCYTGSELRTSLPHSHIFLKGYKEKVEGFHTKANEVFLEGIQKAQSRQVEMGNEDQQEIGLIDTILEMFENCKEPMTDADAIAILRDVMFGCADGSYQPLTWALLFLCDHPDVLRKLQGEIDNVLGPKMPELADRDALPFVEATIREVLRLSEITTLGIPRRTTDDVTVAGFDIPKDTLTIVNVYNIHRDAQQWESPEMFNPERFFKDTELQDLRPMSELSLSSLFNRKSKLPRTESRSKLPVLALHKVLPEV